MTIRIGNRLGTDKKLLKQLFYGSHCHWAAIRFPGLERELDEFMKSWSINGYWPSHLHFLNATEYQLLGEGTRMAESQFCSHSSGLGCCPDQHAKLDGPLVSSVLWLSRTSVWIVILCHRVNMKVDDLAKALTMALQARVP